LTDAKKCQKYHIAYSHVPYNRYHEGCHMWSKSCLPFRSTWVHSQIL